MAKLIGTRPDGDYGRTGIIGTNKTGKSTALLKVIRKTYDLRHHRVLILVGSNPSAYDGIPRLTTYDELRRWESGMVKFWDYDHPGGPVGMIKELLKIIDEGNRNGEFYLQNGAIVFDDCSNYLESYVPREIRTFLGDHRHAHLDLFFVSHAITDFPSILRRRMMFYTLHKTLDPFTSEQDIVRLKYTNGVNLYKAWAMVMKDPDNFAKITIKTGV